MDYSTLLPQIVRLQAQVPKSRTLLVLIKTLLDSPFAKEKNKKSLAYIYLTRLLWEYIAETLPAELLKIPEPWKEDPMTVMWNKHPVTQELACSILDYHTITKELQPPAIKTVLTLGANHWQLGYVFLHQIPHLKYIVADAPEALEAAQAHFVRLFPRKQIFAHRPFDSLEAVHDAFDKASICFVEPSQLSLLPKASIDLGITIDILDKLNPKEADTYFVQLARLMNGYFYFKEQKDSALKEADYHVPDEWEEVFWRTCPFYPRSFEALFVQGGR